MRGDSSWTRAGEQGNLIGQMGLIEIAEFCRHSYGAVRRRSSHGRLTRSAFAPGTFCVGSPEGSLVVSEYIQRGLTSFVRAIEFQFELQ
jgi:hypothetical protein